MSSSHRRRHYSIVTVYLKSQSLLPFLLYLVFRSSHPLSSLLGAEQVCSCRKREPCAGGRAMSSHRSNSSESRDRLIRQGCLSGFCPLPTLSLPSWAPGAGERVRRPSFRREIESATRTGSGTAESTSSTPKRGNHRRRTEGKLIIRQTSQSRSSHAD